MKEVKFSDSIYVLFFETNVPDYSHEVKVIVDKTLIGRGWLKSCYNPNIYAAKYFYRKIALKQDDPMLLEKAAKKVSAPKPWTIEGFKLWAQEHTFDIVGQTGWRSYSISPLDNYIKEMREAGTWHEGQFKAYNGYMNHTRWMTRLNNYFDELGQSETIPYYVNEFHGYDVVNTLNGKEWDKAKYDLYTYHSA